MRMAFGGFYGYVMDRNWLASHDEDREKDALLAEGGEKKLRKRYLKGNPFSVQ